MRSTNYSGSLDHFFDSRLCVNQLLKDLSTETVRAFESVKRTRAYPKGSLIFSEGESPQGVYLLRQGRAKLILDLGRKREQVVRIAEAGEVLVSNTVKDLVAGSGISFEDRGTHELKGIPGEWRLFAVSSA